MIGTSVTGKCSSGFTLVEMLVVLAIMVLMVGLIPTALQHLIPGRQLAATTDEVATALRDLQSSALSTGRPTKFVIGDGAYTLQGASGKGDKDVSLPRGVTIDLQDVDATLSAQMAFFPDGSSTGGRVEVRHGSLVRTVLVTRLLGRVREQVVPQ